MSFHAVSQGFQALLEREWLDFGHKFGDRCGNAVCTEDVNERCPVFLQWLDCVYQLTRQFPCDFQFNMAYLVSAGSGWGELTAFVVLLPWSESSGSEMAYVSIESASTNIGRKFLFFNSVPTGGSFGSVS